MVVSLFSVTYTNHSPKIEWKTELSTTDRQNGIFVPNFERKWFKIVRIFSNFSL
jgi:hypothetical protein